MANSPMQSAAKVAEKAAARIYAAACDDSQPHAVDDTSSAASLFLPAAQLLQMHVRIWEFHASCRATHVRVV